MIRALIFDIDDTLSDWDAAIAEGLRRLEPEIPAPHADELQDRFQAALSQHVLDLRDGVVVDRKHWLLLADPLPIWRSALPDANPALASRLAGRLRALLEPVPYPDAAPALSALSGRYTLGVLSNNPFSRETLRRLGLLQHFAAIVAAEEPWRKPHPEAFRRALEAVGALPSETLYVGDSLAHDVEGALAAGIAPVWVDRFDESYALPDGALRIGSLDELPSLVEQLAGYR